MDNERLKLWLNFWRFVLGSVVVAIISTGLNHQIQQAQLDMDAQALEDNYIQSNLTTYMLAGDKERITFVNFLRFVSAREDRRENYSSLHKDLVNELEKKEQLVKLEKDSIAIMESVKKQSVDLLESKQRKVADLNQKVNQTSSGPEKTKFENQLKEQNKLLDSIKLATQRYERIINERRAYTEAIKKDISNPEMSLSSGFVPIDMDLKKGEVFPIKDLDLKFEATKVNNITNKATITIVTGEIDNNPVYLLGINKYAIFSKGGVDYKLLVTNIYNQAAAVNQSRVEMTLSRPR